MLKLTYAELTDPRTLTYKAFNRIQEDIDLLEKKWARLKAFDLALTGHLQTYGEMDYELFNCAVAWFEHSDLTVSEIFQKIREMGGLTNPPTYVIIHSESEVNEMNNFLFEDHIDGGFFFVQCDTVDEAYEIILEEIASAHPCCDRDTLMMDYDYLGCYTDAQAEAMGYDTY